MKKITLLIAALFLFVVYANAWTPFTLRFPVLDDANEIHVYAGESIGAAIGDASTGDVIYVHPGTYTVSAVSNPASKILYFRGMDKNAVIFTGTDTILTTSSDIYLENLSVISTDDGSEGGNTLITASNAEYHFDNCYLKLRHQIFTDSVWLDDTELNGLAADSIVFSGGYSEINKCYQSGYGWSFSGSGDHYLRNCSGYSTVGENLILSGGTITITGCDFETDDFRSLVGSDSVSLKMYNSGFLNESEDSATVRGLEDVKARIIDVTMSNMFFPAARATRIDAFDWDSDDTLWVGNCSGMGAAHIDSGSADPTTARVYWESENNWTGLSLYDGVSGDAIHRLVFGTNGDRFMNTEMFFFDADSGATDGCTLGAYTGDGVFLHAMNTAGVSTVGLTKYGVLALMGGNCGLIIGDTTNSNVTKIEFIYSVIDTFTGTEQVDTVLFAGAVVGDPVWVQPINTDTVKVGDVLTAWAGTDTIFVSRSLIAANVTSALKFALLFMQVTN